MCQLGVVIRWHSPACSFAGLKHGICMRFAATTDKSRHTFIGLPGELPSPLGCSCLLYLSNYLSSRPLAVDHGTCPSLCKQESRLGSRPSWIISEVLLLIRLIAFIAMSNGASLKCAHHQMARVLNDVLACRALLWRGGLPVLQIALQMAHVPLFGGSGALAVRAEVRAVHVQFV